MPCERSAFCLLLALHGDTDPCGEGKLVQLLSSAWFHGTTQLGIVSSGDLLHALGRPRAIHLARRSDLGYALGERLSGELPVGLLLPSVSDAAGTTCHKHRSVSLLPTFPLDRYALVLAQLHLALSAWKRMCIRQFCSDHFCRQVIRCSEVASRSKET